MALCLQVDVEKRLQIDFTNPAEPVVTSLIAAAQGHIEREYGGPLETATYTSELHTGIDRSAIFLRHHPVTSITTVVEDGVTLTATDYSWTVDGTIRRLDTAGRSIWWKTYKIGGVVVTYVAGYGASDIPEDIRDVCAWMVAESFRRGLSGDTAVIASEGLGEYSVGYFEGFVLMTEEQRQIIRDYRLGNHRRIGFGVA